MAEEKDNKKSIQVDFAKVKESLDILRNFTSDNKKLNEKGEYVAAPEGEKGRNGRVLFFEGAKNSPHASDKAVLKNYDLYNELVKKIEENPAELTADNAKKLEEYSSEILKAAEARKGDLQKLVDKNQANTPQKRTHEALGDIIKQVQDSQKTLNKHIKTAKGEKVDAPSAGELVIGKKDSDIGVEDVKAKFEERLKVLDGLGDSIKKTDAFKTLRDGIAEVAKDPAKLTADLAEKLTDSINDLLNDKQLVKGGDRLTLSGMRTLVKTGRDHVKKAESAGKEAPGQEKPAEEKAGEKTPAEKAVEQWKSAIEKLLDSPDGKLMGPDIKALVSLNRDIRKKPGEAGAFLAEDGKFSQRAFEAQNTVQSIIDRFNKKQKPGKGKKSDPQITDEDVKNDIKALRSSMQENQDLQDTPKRIKEEKAAAAGNKQSNAADVINNMFEKAVNALDPSLKAYVKGLQKEGQQYVTQASYENKSAEITKTLPNKNPTLGA